MKAIIVFFISFSILAISGCEKDKSNDQVKPDDRLLIELWKDGHLTTKYVYDSVNRLVQINYYFADTLSYTEYYYYDVNNRKVKRTLNECTKIYSYDSIGKLESYLRSYEGIDNEWRTEYFYSNGRITNAIRYVNDTEESTIEYNYDSRGNTIERTEYYSDLIGGGIVAQHKFTYDNKINPRHNLSVVPSDIVQKNNPTYVYYYLAFSSMIHPEYNISYEYDDAGYPVKEYRDSNIIEYKYDMIPE